MLTPADVRNKQFGTTRTEPGYNEEQVDNFLDRIEAALDRLTRENEQLLSNMAGVLRAGPEADLQHFAVPLSSGGALPVMPADVRTVIFRTTRFKPGYIQQDVDRFLDEAEAALARLLDDNAAYRAQLAATLRSVAERRTFTPAASAPQPALVPAPVPQPAPDVAPVNDRSTDGFAAPPALPSPGYPVQTAVPVAPPARPPGASVRTDAPAVIEVAVRPGSAAGTLGVEVVHSPVGEASAVAPFDLDDLLARREQAHWAVLASAVTSRRVLPETERPVQEIGKALFRALLGAGEVAGRYRAAAAVAAERGQRLRVVLRIDDPALAVLPWEAMYDEAAEAYVCRQGQLVRHVAVAMVPPPLRVQPPLRILGVVSSPRGLSALDVEKEQDQLARALARPVSQGLAELHWATAATWDDLQGRLFDGPWHVVHYIGHGDFDPERDEGVLALVGGDGRARYVPAHQLVDLLRQASPMPRLVVLNSCASARGSAADLFSGTAAALVRGGVSSVAAMQFAISDQSAAAFARGFYTAVAYGRGVDEALSSGRVAILGTGEQTLEWLTPVLYLRGGAARLFALD